MQVNTIICGDCLEVMKDWPDNCVDLVLTDPPYGVNYEGGTTKRNCLVGDKNPEAYNRCLPAIAKVAKDKAAFYIFYADGDATVVAAVLAAVLAANLVIRNNLIWNKHQAQFGALSAQYKQKHEPFLYCHKKGQSPKWYGPTNEVTVWDISRLSRCDLHPTQKPLNLFLRAINNSSCIGDLILDPFCGSGTACVAAKMLGRRYIGIDISPEYCEIARQRLEAVDTGVPVREQKQGQQPLFPA